MALSFSRYIFKRQNLAPYHRPTTSPQTVNTEKPLKDEIDVRIALLERLKKAVKRL